MKLGEALSERALKQRKIGELRQRINANVTVEEGTQPAEDPEELLAEVRIQHIELALLIARINMTNAQTRVEGYGSMTEALAERERMGGLISTYTQAADAAGLSGARRYMRSELTLTRLVDVGDLRDKVEQQAQELRQLDNLIQATNWTTELV